MTSSRSRSERLVLVLALNDPENGDSGRGSADGEIRPDARGVSIEAEVMDALRVVLEVPFDRREDVVDAVVLVFLDRLDLGGLDVWSVGTITACEGTWDSDCDR